MNCYKAHGITAQQALQQQQDPHRNTAQAQLAGQLASAAPCLPTQALVLVTSAAKASSKSIDATLATTFHIVNIMTTPNAYTVGNDAERMRRHWQ